MPTSDFSDDDLAALRAHGIVLFADRVIFDAQPPMPPEQIAAVQAQCDGPLPDALLALWQLTAGGSLDYQLSLPMNGNEEAISWTELFYNGSNRYRDLQGWIDHEREQAENVAAERGKSWGGLLDVLPFGGFEYCDRLYVVTTPGAPDCGHVLAWKQGMPPGWHGMMHADGLATVATDVYGAFRALQLDSDPLGPDAEVGTDLLDYLDERRESHGLPDALAERLIAFYRRAMIDWRTPLADGTLLGQPRLVRVAQRAAVDGDDAPLVAQLAAAGMQFDQVLAGSLNPVAYAVRRQRFAAAAALLDAGAPADNDTLASLSGAVPASLIRALLAAGAAPSAAAMAQCVAYGADDSARLIHAALGTHGDDADAAYRAARDTLLAQLLDKAKRVRSGKLSHYLGLDGLQAHAARLQAFVP